MRTAAVFCLALLSWLSALHLLFRPEPRQLRDGLAAGQRAFWASPNLQGLRRSNPEWELMARMFATLAFANLALEGDAEAAALAERIALDSDALERARGPAYFLLPYGAHATRSLFVDGELALMLAARQLLRPDADAASLRDRVARIERALNESPLLLAESYPDEGWTFCNTVAVAGLRLSDAALGTDHSALIERWLRSARRHLVDGRTGLLVSSFHRAGAVRDGPEGSTLWLAAHMLETVDPELARRQYALARASLGRGALGFGWAAEWPTQWPGRADVDSGPTIPLVDANAGSSGLALLGASAFGDLKWQRELLASVQLAAFPVREGAAVRFAAGNALADAVALYALSQGPLWACVRARAPGKDGGRCSAPRS